MHPRNLQSSILAALADTPVVLLLGARQVGKSTLVQQVAGQLGARYATLDDLGLLAAARRDPEAFLAGLGTPVVLDEVQRAPDLLLPIKAAVDRKRRAGAFLLTGSTNPLAGPAIAEALVGRMEVLTLWPFSRGELLGIEERFVDWLFSADAPTRVAAEPRDALLDAILAGGFPEAVARATVRGTRTGAWFDSYVKTLLEREVRDLSQVLGLADLPRLLSLLASRSGFLMNVAELSRTTTIPQTTLRHYLALLQAVFVLRLVPAWTANPGKRLVKAAKVVLADTGLMAHLLGFERERIQVDTSVLGALLETFVALELHKQIGWSRTRPGLYHYRTHAGREVDFVLEDRAGRLVGIEVKAAATLRGGEAASLEALQKDLPRRFHRGILLYGGREVVPLGERLHAMPLAALWRVGSQRAKSAHP